MATSLILGPVLFQAFEVPEAITLGGRQQLAVHSLPGGGRVVDVMGPDDAPIAWSGVFSGPTAAERVRLLEQLRRAGDALDLVWDAWRFTVLIQTFAAHVENSWWVPYRLELCVLPDAGVMTDEAAPAAPTAAEAIALGAGDGLDDRIEAASAGLQSSDLTVVVGAAGSMAQLVTARAFTGVDL